MKQPSVNLFSGRGQIILNVCTLCVDKFDLCHKAWWKCLKTIQINSENHVDDQTIFSPHKSHDRLFELTIKYWKFTLYKTSAQTSFVILHDSFICHDSGKYCRCKQRRRGFRRCKCSFFLGPVEYKWCVSLKNIYKPYSQPKLESHRPYSHVATYGSRDFRFPMGFP